MDNKTLISEMEFSQSWRLKKIITLYNLSKDKPDRIITVGDLAKYDIIQFLGVGKKQLNIFSGLWK